MKIKEGSREEKGKAKVILGNHKPCVVLSCFCEGIDIRLMLERVFRLTEKCMFGFYVSVSVCSLMKGGRKTNQN